MKVSEEVPFKSMRTTISEDAFDKLDWLLKNGYFRSYSMTIEECVRAIWDIVNDTYTVLGYPVASGGTVKKANLIQQAEAYRRIILRLSRFIGYQIETVHEK